MPSYRKRPKVTRFKRQQTFPGREIRIATVERRERPRSERKSRPTRSLRKR